MSLDTAAPLGIAFLGLILGMRHATDPDHLIAITTILSREERIGAATRVGLLWGIGHSLTVLIVGAAIIVFKLAIPVRLGLWMEFAVAIVLILLGVGSVISLIRGAGRSFLGNVKSADAPVIHIHQHKHSGMAHVHVHVHSHAHGDHHAGGDAGGEHIASKRTGQSFAARRPLLRSFGVGLVHGLAGSAAIALLALAAIPQPIWATLYLMIFCAGTILGMCLITTAIAAPFMVASQRLSWMHQGFVTGAGLLSFGFGVCLVYQVGVVERLFVSTPIWIPR